MKEAIKIVNSMTGLEFVPNPELLAYAKSDPARFSIVYDETVDEEDTEVFSEKQLQEMSVPDLRKLVDGLDCDKRNKDSMIAAILKARE